MTTTRLETVKQQQQAVNQIHRDTNHVCGWWWWCLSVQEIHIMPNVHVSLARHSSSSHSAIQQLLRGSSVCWPHSFFLVFCGLYGLMAGGGVANCIQHVHMRDTKWELTTCQRCTMVYTLNLTRSIQAWSCVGSDSPWDWDSVAGYCWSARLTIKSSSRGDGHVWSAETVTTQCEFHAKVSLVE